MDRMGRSELHYRALEGDLDGIRTRIAAGDSVGAPDHAGFTPLHFAAQQSQSAAAAYLIEAGAPVDAQDKFGNKPLFKAVFDSRGQGDTVEALLSAGANPDLPNHSGVTPRELAQSIAKYDITRFLQGPPEERLNAGHLAPVVNAAPRSGGRSGRIGIWQRWSVRSAASNRTPTALESDQ